MIATTKNTNQGKSSEQIVAELKQKFCAKLDALAYERSHYEVFCNWANLAALALHQFPYQAGLLPKDKLFERIEAQYLEQAAKHSKEILEGFASLLAITLLALNQQWGDFLGSVYMEMELGGKKSKQATGEFFTPYSLAKLSAEITLSDCEEIIERQGYITISEPAVGAGSMLIAACEVVVQKGYEPQTRVLFEAVDINPLCCHMSYIQFAALDLSGIVCHGDTLRNKVWQRWATPGYQMMRRFLSEQNDLQDNQMPTAKEITLESEQLELLLKPGPSTNNVAQPPH